MTGLAAGKMIGLIDGRVTRLPEKSDGWRDDWFVIWRDDWIVGWKDNLIVGWRDG